MRVASCVLVPLSVRLREGVRDCVGHWLRVADSEGETVGLGDELWLRVPTCDVLCEGVPAPDAVGLKVLAADAVGVAVGLWLAERVPVALGSWLRVGDWDGLCI